MSEQQCRHSSTADRPSRRRRGSGYTRRKSCSQFVQKKSLWETSRHKQHPLPSLPCLPGVGLHVSPQRHQLRRRHVTGDRHEQAQPAGEASAPGQPGLGVRPMRGQHVTAPRPMRDEKARAPVAWSVSHFWARLRREASLSLSYRNWRNPCYTFIIQPYSQFLWVKY